MTVKGMLFQPGRAQVRFGNGEKNYVIVEGEVEDSETIRCQTGNYQQFGAMPVDVRVDINGAGWTVNKMGFTYFANTGLCRRPQRSSSGPCMLVMFPPSTPAACPLLHSPNKMNACITSCLHCLCHCCCCCCFCCCLQLRATAWPLGLAYCPAWWRACSFRS